MRPSFFQTVMVITLAAVVFGFGPSFFWRAPSLGPQPDVLVRHGLVFTLWAVLCVVQTTLIAAKRPALHKVLGLSSLLLAGAMIATGIEVAAYAYDIGTTAGPLDRAGFQFLPFSDLLGFGLLYGLALGMRSAAAQHKRYMVLAAVSLLGPALGRFFENLSLPGELGFVTLALLAASVAVYDRYTLGQISRATAVGLTILYGKLALTLPLGQSTLWADWVHRFYGT